MMKMCRVCGQLEGIKEYDTILWEIYHRIRDGRSTWEALVFTSDYIQENILDEDDHDSMMTAMENDMHNRGLCPECGRPDLRGVKPEDIMTEEESRELHDMWA